MKKIIIILLFALIPIGCVKQPPKLTHDEFLEMTTKHYEGVSKEQIFSAVEKLFKLNDGSDFQIAYTKDGLRASRFWIMALSSGRDVWDLEVKENKTGLDVSIDYSRYLNSLLLMKKEPLTFYLFWERLNYLLGKSNHWITCDELEQKIETGQLSGYEETLCNHTVKDNVPT